jgi:parallel beta-helix repeat protein
MEKRVSAILLTLLLTSMLTMAFNIQPVKASGTIYIRADGSIDPLTAPISTADNVTYTFTDNINDSIVVERDNIAVDGAGYTMTGSGSENGITLTSRSNVTVGNVTIKNFTYGTYLFSSSNNTLSGNNVANNNVGIVLYSSSYNTLSGNNVTANNDTGIVLDSSSYNTLSGNNVTANSKGGIYLYHSSYNTLSGNNVTANGEESIRLDSSSNNTLSGNNVANNWYGVVLDSSSYNTLSGNNVTANNWYGVVLASSSNNSILHNSFVNNTYQAFTYGSINVWDDGYPSGGNYWSDHTGADLHSGPFQNETGSDGIGDAPYVIDASNRDNYPLMKPYPWASHDIGITALTASKTVIGQGYNVSINGVLFNYGNETETFNVTVYANATLINQTQITLTSRNSTTITFTRNTTGFAKGNYTISGIADTVPGETDTADNNFTGGWIIVSMVGDVTGVGGLWDFVPDGKCDGKDITAVCLCFGSYPGCPPPLRWEPNCDITNHGKVDGKDITVIALHFGQHDP